MSTNTAHPRSLVLKSILHILIKKFGVELINDQLAEIFTDESNDRCNYDWDDLAEAYDNINKNMKFKTLFDKKNP